MIPKNSWYDPIIDAFKNLFDWEIEITVTLFRIIIALFYCALLWSLYVG